jgi:hypothetical protein
MLNKSTLSKNQLEEQKTQLLKWELGQEKNWGDINNLN